VRSAKRVLFVEEGIENGGAGMLLREALIKLSCELDGKYFIKAIDDNFASPDKKCDVYSYLGFSPEALAEKILN